MLAQQLNRTFIRRRQTFEYLDGGRLPCPIWPQQPKTLPREHFEIEPIDRSYIRKPLHQPLAPQRDALVHWHDWFSNL
jgi:hypothetical protein